MDKKKLNELVRVKTGWDLETTERSIDVVLGSIRQLLQQGDRLTIHSFGSFNAKLAKARRARNLQTGATILVPAKRKVKFRPSPEFLE